MRRWFAGFSCKLSDAMKEIRSITVLGAGTMGLGIAHVSAAGGFSTILYDISRDILDRALEQLRKNLAQGVDKGKLSSAERDAALGRLRMETDFAPAVRDADLVIEAVPEELELKLATFRRLDELTRPTALLATNTSALSITEMAAATRRADLVAGMHFFNPAHIMKLVELVRGLETSQETLGTLAEVARKMGKETVLVKESPGFLTTRVNALIGNEAFAMLQEGLASAEDIDKAMRLGLNHPMGPLEMADLVGLDTRLRVLQHLHRTLGEKFRPSPLLEQYVKAGRLGKKAGRGVYCYQSGQRIAEGAPLPEVSRQKVVP